MVTYAHSHHLRRALFFLWLLKKIDCAALLSSWPLKQSCGASLRCVFKSPANMDSIDCLSFALQQPPSLDAVHQIVLRWLLPLPKLADSPRCLKTSRSMSGGGFRHAIFSDEPPDQHATRCRYFILGDKMASLAGGLESLKSSYCNWKIIGQDKMRSEKTYKQTSIKGQFAWSFCYF